MPEMSDGFSSFDTRQGAFITQHRATELVMIHTSAQT